ncbi:MULTISPECIES: S-layer homology domain-containing protein [Aneurinibacillus]|uniref:S-layer homology domain-containing protein n=1 Tax=Aneurinibacillus thermoaerophilus TaxID=143495 RepID=A0A1G8BZV6_ANETH|nr:MULTISPECIES: S-layer homology domain-containing protein [Aneurinibacillus]AMA71963.1 hypothetical protein ACH33_03310 [Aneurinibacillus sp. XH2]MED0675091.1 S-layer homology domain-containing protein [Aneurinibacillus thermoaerophilus]MED0679239.1 S-layer homology domain-containing protein [Aneurinibacillus thermoaerophilus]MED0737125.1 S-layer homology domain-containing protein [Aneurinibacillus thermoaerophilus]MED0757171.1 S-layer homology domain-containing protein [Aneurinibacillus the
MKRKFTKLALAMGLSLSVVSVASAANFKDFDNFYWAKPAVDKLVAEGIVSGYKDGTFRPGKQVSRAEFVTMANKAFGKFNENAIVDFSDVHKYQWFYQQVASAYQAGYVTGYQGKFAPNKPITRFEAAVMMARLLELDVTKVDTAQKLDDFNQIPVWAVGSVSALVDKKVMKGYTDNTFRGAKYITRAEAAVLIEQARAYLYGKLK